MKGNMRWIRPLRATAPMLLAAALLAGLLAAGCAPEEGDQGDLKIIGTYTDEFGTDHDITNDTWTIGSSTYHIENYDNARDFLVAQNDDGNSFNAGLWSRFDWVFYEGSLYYCQQETDAESAGEAQTNTDADRTDPSAGGCGLPDNDFAWTNLTP